MEKHSTIYGNRIIGEYMGVSNISDTIAEHELKYWHEWDALMPVVSKIRNNEFVDDFKLDLFDKIVLSGNWVNNKFMFEKRCNLCGMETVRQSLYSVCVAFIEWHNKNCK